MFNKFITYLQDRSGATGIEYGLIFGTISVTVAAGSFMLGNDISSVFEAFSNHVNAEITEVNR